MMGVGHIAIAGNMGVGKSTLTRVLADRLKARAYFESVDDHPYLERFYEDMPRWAFQSQFFFLSQAFSQHCQILAEGTVAVQDRTIYEHFHVFASSLYHQGHLSDDDFRVLRDHYQALEAVVPGPDVMVYLRASIPTLKSRIQTRDRDFENTVSVDYLADLEGRYEQWMSGYDPARMLIVDTDELDIFDADQRESLLVRIEERLRDRVASLAVA